MKYVLENLDQLISITLDPKQAQHQSITKEWIEEQAKLACTEKERIQLSLLRRPSKKSKIKAMARVVGYYQSSLIRLLDRLYYYQKNIKDHHSPICQLYITLEGYLKQLLTIIEEHFDRFVDTSHKIPETYLAVWKRLLRFKALELRRILLPLLKDKTLIELVSTCLTSLCTDREVHLISLNDIIYRKELIAKLLATQWNQIDNPDLYLQEILICFNYNHSGFIVYSIESLRNLLLKHKTLPSKRKWLLFYQKELQQLSILPNIGLKTNFPSVITELTGWLHAELSYIHHFESEYSEVDPAQKESANAHIEENSFVEMPLTEVGVFVLGKAAVDSNLVLNQTYKGLMMQIGPGIATKHKKGISAATVVKKGDRITPQVKDQVIDILREMIRLIGKY